MTPMLKKLIEAVNPDFNFDSRDFKETNDPTTWYRVGLTPPTLMVPYVEYMRKNILELDKFAEAVNAFNFYKPNVKDILYDWENLDLEEFSGIDCIDKLKELKKLLQNEIVSVDIETRNLSYDGNQLLSIGFAWDWNKSWAFYDIPIAGSIGRDRYDGHVQLKTLYALRDLLSDKNITFVWHNGKFDCTRLKYMCNIDARVDEDTMLKHYARINEKRGTHGLKILGPLYLQAPQWDDALDKIKKEYCKKNKVKIADFTYDLIPTRILIPYMQRDCLATLRLNYLFDQLAEPDSEFIYRKLIEASAVYGRVELNGLSIDLDYLEDLEWDLDCKIAEAEKHVNQSVAHYWNPACYAADTGAKCSMSEPFNLSSPKQLKWVLSQALGHEVQSTNADVLENLATQCELGLIANEEAADFIRSIKELRNWSKYMNTYVQGLRGQLCKDIKVRGTFNLHGTETGRLSSSNPNLQNIPRNKMIKNLICSKQGYQLVQLDYSQAELRVLAMLSEDASMIKVYQDGLDLHDAVATDMFGPDFDKEQRNMAKTINFGIAYGRGPSSISENFGKSMAESQEIINKWFRSKPNVKQYINSQRRKPLRGEPCVSLLGRKRHFVVTNENMYHVQNEYINTPIQSLASDFTMLSLLNIDQAISDNEWDAKIVSTVHDSIILEVKDNKELIDIVAQTCKDIMATTPLQYVPDCVVPFKADVEVGYRWGDLKEWVI